MQHLEARQRTLETLSRRMDAVHKRHMGTMRFVGTEPDRLLDATRKLPDPGVEAITGAVPGSGGPDEPLLDQWWDPDVKLLIREMDPTQPGMLVLSLSHLDFIERVPDPWLGVLVHVHVRLQYEQGREIRRVAFSRDYFAPENEEAQGRGRLLIDVADVEGVPVLGLPVAAIDGRPGWAWQTQAAIAPETGEPVMLLRFNVRGAPVGAPDSGATDPGD